jgi:hypothetical protein
LSDFSVHTDELAPSSRSGHLLTTFFGNSLLTPSRNLVGLPMVGGGSVQSASRMPFKGAGFPLTFPLPSASFVQQEGRKAPFVVPVSLCDLEIENYDLEDTVKE